MYSYSNATVSSPNHMNQTLQALMQIQENMAMMETSVGFRKAALPISQLELKSSTLVLVDS